MYVAFIWEYSKVSISTRNEKCIGKETISSDDNDRGRKVRITRLERVFYLKFHYSSLPIWITCLTLILHYWLLGT